VPKQILGKSLGNLLETGKPVSEPSADTAKKLEPERLSSRGLKVLVVGSEQTKYSPSDSSLSGKSPIPSLNNLSPQKRKTNQFFVLFVADILLIIMAFALILGRPTPPSKLEWALACSAIVIGAILSYWGIINRFPKS
jgi:hypothetical protein